MNKKNYLFLLIICSLSCSNGKGHSSKVETETDSIFVAKVSTDTLKNIEDFGILMKGKKDLSYLEMKRKVNKTRQKLANQNLSKDSISTIFTELLVNDIIPYWYGTAWSFEGHTAIPKKGVIACGYFVSTTLRDMGLQINRYKLAQQSPINEAKTLALNQPIFEINNSSKDANIRQLKRQLKEGIHFIGFDQSHVGYILKRENELFLIHSNFVDNQGVMIEKIEESEVFGYYERFFLVEISHNFELLNKWKNNQVVEIVK